MPLGFLELVATFRDPSEYALQKPVEAYAECCEDYDDDGVIQNICKALRHPHLSGKYVAEPFNERCHSAFFMNPWQHPCKNKAPGLQRGRVPKYITYSLANKLYCRNRSNEIALLDLETAFALCRSDCEALLCLLCRKVSQSCQ